MALWCGAGIAQECPESKAEPCSGRGVRGGGCRGWQFDMSSVVVYNYGTNVKQREGRNGK